MVSFCVFNSAKLMLVQNTAFYHKSAKLHDYRTTKWMVTICTTEHFQEEL